MSVRTDIEYVMRANIMEQRRRSLMLADFSGPELVDPSKAEMEDIAKRIKAATDQILRYVAAALS